MNQRFFGLDILRVVAICMVITAHCCECFYINNFYVNGYEGLNIDIWQQESLQAGIIGAICRACVPIFVVISGFLLLPIKEGTGMMEFYHKRTQRILWPFIIWCFLYGVYAIFKMPMMLGNELAGVWYIKYIGSLFINFPAPVGHLWYIYMILGLYLFAPILSPWIERASKRDMLIFLGIWAASLFFTPIRQYVQPEVLGECYWNPNGLFYSFSGFIGYFMLGAYCRKFLANNDKNYVGIGIVLSIIGFAATLGGFVYQLYNYIPTIENYGNYIPKLETTWLFCQPTVAILTLGIFLCFFKSTTKEDSMIAKAIKDVSQKSYGMYLAHIMLLYIFYELFNPIVDVVWLKILIMALCTIVTTYIEIKILSYLPKSKYIVG